MPSEAKKSNIRKAQGTLLASAVADALGWPHEPNSNRIDESNRTPDNPSSFIEWKRRVGGRYNPYHDLVRRGEYSDDTQLTLCTARSLLYGRLWYQHLTEVELPFFSCYERGAGGATNRAVKAWGSGIAPWESQDPEALGRYFEAGGNGVSMRISPHCLARADDADFYALKRELVLNAVSTHGHPRAILGGVCFGFAVWTCLKQQQTLGYGELLRSVLKESEKWGSYEVDAFPEQWLQVVGRTVKEKFEQLWRDTIIELESKLQYCLDAMGNQSLSIDRDVLNQLGCFGKERGSGTVTSVAAIFLASRYAAEPMAGMLEAVLSRGADSDTLGAMTGNLLGAINGGEWLFPLGESVQDSAYIKQLGASLVGREWLDDARPSDFEKVSPNALHRLKVELRESQIGSEISLPDRRGGKIESVIDNHTTSDALTVKTYLLRCSDGQTLYVPLMSRSSIRKQPSKDDGGKQDQNRETPKEGSEQPVVSGNAKHRGDMQVRITGWPDNCFVLESVKGGSRLGFRLFYSAAELTKCLTDFGISSPHTVLQDLRMKDQPHIDSISIPVNKEEALSRWDLRLASICERERERLAKLYFGDLLIAMMIEQKKMKADYWTWKDTRDGAILKWQVGGRDCSLVLKLEELTSVLLDSECRRRIEALIESSVRKL